MKPLWLQILLFYVLSLPAMAQEYGYTRYDSKDGLASSTVYCMTQDREGFMWFGTEAGLSRFDGTHFESFTQEDGLPDNEVISLFADSKGRVWISPFKKSICYYYKGKIYNQENDTSLKHIHVTDNVARFAEDSYGNVLLMETGRLHVVAPNGRVQTITVIGGQRIVYVSGVARHANGGFWVMERNKAYEFIHNNFTLKDTLTWPSVHYGYAGCSDKAMAWLSFSGKITIRSFVSKKDTRFPGVLGHTNFSMIDAEQVGISSTSGAVIYNINKPDSTLHYLPGLRVSGVIKDTEGNLWFTTLGQGVYRLNSPFVKNLKIKDKNAVNQILCFARYGPSILVGGDMNTIYSLNADNGIPNRKIVPDGSFMDVRDIVKTLYVHGNGIIFTTNLGICHLSKNDKVVHYLEHLTIKNIFPYKNNLLVTTDRNILVVNPVNLNITDTIWHERATTVFASNDTFYIGTLNGLYCRFPDRSVTFMGEKNAAFKNRIAAITKDSNHVFWIATFGAGIIAWKNGQIITRINQQNGLTSNICRTLYLSGHSLWVGTNKGLNKIDLARDFPVKKYTTGDGLISDIINVLYVENNKVFVGTPEGITFFDEQKINSRSRCDLVFTDISVGGQKVDSINMPALIPHAKNNVQFNYVGISYKSVGDIRYRYRLLGLDSNWKITRETFLSYPTLPSGEYELQLQAINKFDVYSKLLSSKFTIEKLLWEKIWFQLLMALLFVTITGLLVWLIIRSIRRREQEKTSINKRIGELEQLARKAQMNPHFIFNSLNSIQQYVMDTDIAGANKFISGFSKLIRQTLDFSSKAEISLEEELGYLSNYLELEKTRLENAFSWSVIIATDVKPAEYYIPPLILQPFVENSVRHGLRYRRDTGGKVTISIKKENEYLVCILEDNGIGRKAALRFKSIAPIEYQSKGLSLTAERIAMLNKDNPRKIIMQIDDLEDDRQNALGTRITLSFPV